MLIARWPAQKSLCIAVSIIYRVAPIKSVGKARPTLWLAVGRDISLSMLGTSFQKRCLSAGCAVTMRYIAGIYGALIDAG